MQNKSVIVKNIDGDASSNHGMYSAIFGSVNIEVCGAQGPRTEKVRRSHPFSLIGKETAELDKPKWYKAHRN